MCFCKIHTFPPSPGHVPQTQGPLYSGRPKAPRGKLGLPARGDSTSLKLLGPLQEGPSSQILATSVSFSLPTSKPRRCPGPCYPPFPFPQGNLPTSHLPGPCPFTPRPKNSGSGDTGILVYRLRLSPINSSSHHFFCSPSQALFSSSFKPREETPAIQSDAQTHAQLDPTPLPNLDTTF